MPLLYLQKILKQKVSKNERAYAARLNKLANISCSSHFPSITWLWYDYGSGVEIHNLKSFSLVKQLPFSDKPYWTVVGRIHKKNDLQALLRAALEKNIRSFRHCNYLTATDVRKLNHPRITISDESQDYSEYLYDVAEQALCSGSKFEDTRRHKRKFVTIYGPKLEVIERESPSQIMQNDVMNLFDDWLDYGTDGSSDSEAELAALKRFFSGGTRDYFGPLMILEFRYDTKLVGLSVNELLGSTAINHFHKANLNLTGISYFIFNTMMVHLNKHNIKILNFQEDCGIQGMRNFKNKMRPSSISANYKLTIKP